MKYPIELAIKSRPLSDGRLFFGDRKLFRTSFRRRYEIRAINCSDVVVKHETLHFQGQNKKIYPKLILNNNLFVQCLLDKNS